MSVDELEYVRKTVEALLDNPLTKLCNHIEVWEKDGRGIELSFGFIRTWHIENGDKVFSFPAPPEEFFERPL